MAFNIKKKAIAVLRLFVKTVVVLFITYLTITLIIFPIAAKFIIQSQGTKLLKHDVKIEAVRFNPFLLKLDLQQFKVLSATKQFVGFDIFSVDLSFLSLFKKELRVTDVLLSGFALNAELLVDGSIDLMALQPDLQDKEEQGAEEDKASEIPLIYLDLLEVSNSSVSFTDNTVKPKYRFDLNNIVLRLSEASTGVDSKPKIQFSANVGLDQGSLSSEVISRPLAQPMECDLNFQIKSFDMTSLSPYLAKFTGQKAKSGKLNLRVDTQIAQEQIKSAHNLNIQSFDFGEKVESEDALNLPFGLALAILEDSNNRIKISLPVKGDMSAPEFEYWPLVGKVARNFFMKIVTKPFSFLASMAGLDSDMSEELAYIKFEPGSYQLMQSEKDKIVTLVNTLKDRPRLSIELSGAYDPEVDVMGVKEDLFMQRFEALKEKSGKTDYRVLYKLYRKEYGVYNAWRAIKAYRKNKQLGVNPGLTQDLVKSASLNEEALEALAQKRATAIYELFVKEGFSSDRIQIKKMKKVQASVGYVPVLFTLKFQENPA